jgi:hypothetical protein
MALHLLRCQWLGVGYYTLNIGRLESGAPSTFAQSGLEHRKNRILCQPELFAGVHSRRARAKMSAIGHPLYRIRTPEMNP